MMLKHLPPVMFNNKYLQNEWSTVSCEHLSQSFQDPEPKMSKIKAAEVVLEGMETSLFGGTGVTPLWYHKTKRKEVCVVVCLRQEKKQKWPNSQAVGDRSPSSLVHINLAKLGH